LSADVEFTKEVFDLLQTLKRMRSRFQNKISTLSSQKISEIRPKNLYETLQLAHESNQALEAFLPSITAEEKEHWRRKTAIGDDCKKMLKSIRFESSLKIEDVEKAVGRLDRLAWLVGGKTVAGKFRFSDTSTLQPEAVNTAFNNALAEAQRTAGDLPDESFENHKRTAALAAGGSGVLSLFFPEVSVAGGLVIGGMAAGVVFAHYFRRKHLAKEAIRTLVEASSAECSNIHNSQNMAEKRQQHLLTSRLTAEIERIENIKGLFAKITFNIEEELTSQLERFLSLSNRWVDEYTALVSPFDGTANSGDSQTPVFYTRMGQVTLSHNPPVCRGSEKVCPPEESEDGQEKASITELISQGDKEATDQAHKLAGQLRGISKKDSEALLNE